MIFEKKARSNSLCSIDMIGYTALISVVVGFVVYGTCAIYGIMGSGSGDKKITFLDLINAFAQMATAGAFFFAVWQYRKVGKQQRQNELSNEAKSQIVKMIEVIDKIETGSQTNLENINTCVSRLINICMGFNEIFKTMEEDIQKAIVRMHWQDMYFNQLRPALVNLEIEPILRDMDIFYGTNLEPLFSQVNAKVYQSEIVSSFKKFYYMIGVLENPIIKDVFSFKGKIESLDFFNHYFLVDSNLNDHLYGLMSIVDIRVVAPLFAVCSPKRLDN